MRPSILIAGGGPAGLATAIRAAERRLSVVVLEKRPPPPDKACGEGLMPPGVAELGEMGVALPVTASARFSGIRYVEGDRMAEARFRQEAGLGVRRTVLVERMAERARELGVELQYGVTVRDWNGQGGALRIDTDGGCYEADVLVGADGLRSRVRRQAGLESKPETSSPARYGVRRHFRVAPWSDFVEVHWGPDVEAYVTPVGPEEVGVAFLWGGEPASFDSLLARFPRLKKELRGAPAASRVRGSGPLCQRVGRRIVGQSVALVGDAAGYLDPLTGEGLTLAFRCARALVDVIASGAPLSEYERRYREVSRTYYVLTGLLLWIGSRPRLRRRLVSALARRPELFEKLLEVHCGQAPLVSLVSPGLAGLAADMVFADALPEPELLWNGRAPE